MPILEEILTHKRDQVAALDEAALRRAAELSPRPLDFLRELRRHAQAGRPGLIAELKRASPSKGLLAPHLDMLAAAEQYAANGAAAISVLTDERFFQGRLETLQTLRARREAAGQGLPLLRKEFIISAAQVYQSRAAGADALLLIAAALPEDALLADLHALALELGLTPLVEVHNRAELERALRLPGLRLAGINNRDLDTFRVSLETTESLRPLLPDGIAVAAESGIHNAQDAARMAALGVDALLVGEALVTAADLPAQVSRLAGIGEAAA
jgi:indole-3-glycerol phosphate synthase